MVTRFGQVNVPHQITLSPCSWASNEYGYFVSRNQRQIMEVLVAKRPDGKYSLPEAFQSNLAAFPEWLQPAVMRAAEQIQA